MKVIALRAEKRRAARTAGMHAPRVVDASLLVEAGRVLEAELREVRGRACALETAHHLLLEALRGAKKP